MGGPKQRALLLALLLHLNQPVSIGWLTEALWEDRAPASATANLRSYIHALRRSLSGFEGVEITALGRCYQLQAASGQLDLTSFEQAAADGRAALRRGDHSAAAALLQRAINLWRGEAGHGIPCGRSMGARLAALQEQYSTAVEDHAEAVIHLGARADTFSRLRDLLSRESLRERAWGLLMKGLHGAGDTAGALLAYGQARKHLVAELGIEPGAELRRIHQNVLNRDPGPSAQMRHNAASGTDAGPGQSRPVPRQLPRPLLCRGRERMTEAVTDVLRREEPFARLMVISGSQGVGKSAMALRAAHAVSDRFPDGQLYVDWGGLSGGTPTRPSMSSRHLLAGFLSALGEPVPAPGADTSECASRFRSATADLSLLLVLDGVPDAGQVRPLLPWGRHCAVLITSRRRLALDYAEHLQVEPLSRRESMALLTEFAGAARIAASPRATHDIVELCAGLPGAIRHVGELLSTRPDLGLAQVAGALRAEGRGLPDPAHVLEPLFAASK
ncbi:MULTISPECIES: BTAD domain-containing putative transcriptional regulator [unclassified Streptomyces]|uniref:AfsR/SARP family transcriptional regulator n=1 Tax=unclassified Streptomyces TaxID=2593676 RepID=UPI00336AE945